MPECFPMNFAKYLRTTFLQSTSGRLLMYTEVTSSLEKNTHNFLSRKTFGMQTFVAVANFGLLLKSYKKMQEFEEVSFKLNFLYRG